MEIPNEFGDCLSQVLRIIAEALELNSDDVDVDKNIYVDLGVDSLAVVALFVELKRSFGTPEPESSEEYQQLSTARLITSYVWKHGIEARSAT